MERWLLRVGVGAVCALALYAYSAVLLDHYAWKVGVTQAVNALMQARGSVSAPAPGPRP